MDIMLEQKKLNYIPNHICKHMRCVIQYRCTSAQCCKFKDNISLTTLIKSPNDIEAKRYC